MANRVNAVTICFQTMIEVCHCLIQMTILHNLPESVVFKFVVASHCEQTSEGHAQRIENLGSSVSPYLEKKVGKISWLNRNNKVLFQTKGNCHTGTKPVLAPEI